MMHVDCKHPHSNFKHTHTHTHTHTHSHTYTHTHMHTHQQVGTISPDQFYADLLRAVGAEPTDANVAAVHSAQMEYLARFTSDAGRTEQITALLRRIRASGCVPAWNIFVLRLLCHNIVRLCVDEMQRRTQDNTIHGTTTEKLFSGSILTHSHTLTDCS